MKIITTSLLTNKQFLLFMFLLLLGLLFTCYFAIKAYHFDDYYEIMSSVEIKTAN